MVIFDANVLIALVSKKTPSDDLARLNALISDLSKRRLFVGIPTPVLAEFLVKTDAATQAVLDALERKSSLRVIPFDKMAAYECSMLDKKALSNGNKRGSAKSAPYQKIKVDRQILAIANGADMLVSADQNLIALAKDVGLKAVRIEELALPAAALQQPLDFESQPAASALTLSTPAMPLANELPG